MRGLACLALAVLGAAAFAQSASAPPALRFDGGIPLGEASGRIDHLAFDPGRGRLFAAERGNDCVSVLDASARRVLRRLPLPAPQGIAFSPALDALFVSSGADGSVVRFDGEALRPGWRALLGEDADNLRLDPDGARIAVGYGAGALAVLDAATGATLRTVALPVHPESFQLESAGARAYVNLADLGEVAVVDRVAGRLLARWPLPVRGNFPMAYDEDAGRLWIVSREPPALLLLDSRSGGVLGRADTCRDADDVFLDGSRGRVYVICGEGVIDVFVRRDGGFARLERIPTAKGARTGLLVPALDRLMLAVRASGAASAAIRIYQPVP